VAGDRAALTGKALGIDVPEHTNFVFVVSIVVARAVLLLHLLPCAVLLLDPGEPCQAFGGIVVLEQKVDVFIVIE
jgi:hypothetical protein